MYKNNAKNRCFPSLIDLKIIENAFFINCFIRCTVIFEAEMNFKIFVTKGEVELHLFKVLGVIYAPIRPD
jgi:hypothetical protein